MDRRLLLLATLFTPTACDPAVLVDPRVPPELARPPASARACADNSLVGPIDDEPPPRCPPGSTSCKPLTSQCDRG